MALVLAARLTRRFTAICEPSGGAQPHFASAEAGAASRWKSHLGGKQRLVARAASWHGLCNCFGTFPPAMLETTAIILVFVWLLGLVSSYTMGGFIHVLLIAATIAIMIRIVRSNHPAR